MENVFLFSQESYFAYWDIQTLNIQNWDIKIFLFIVQSFKISRNLKVDPLMPWKWLNKLTNAIVITT